MEPININPSSPLELRTNSIGYLNEIRKWTMFFSVLGFICILLLLIIGLAAGTFMSMAGIPSGGSIGIALGIFYLIIGGIMFVPMLYLFRFSRFTKKAIEENDSLKIESGFQNLKKYFRFTGIFTIIILSIYLVIFIAIVIGGFAGTFFNRGF